MIGEEESGGCVAEDFGDGGSELCPFLCIIFCGGVGTRQAEHGGILTNGSFS